MCTIVNLLQAGIGDVVVIGPEILPFKIVQIEHFCDPGTEHERERLLGLVALGGERCKVFDAGKKVEPEKFLEIDIEGGMIRDLGRLTKETNEAPIYTFEELLALEAMPIGFMGAFFGHIYNAQRDCTIEDIEGEYEIEGGVESRIYRDQKFNYLIYAGGGGGMAAYYGPSVELARTLVLRVGHANEPL